MFCYEFWKYFYLVGVRLNFWEPYIYVVMLPIFYFIFIYFKVCGHVSYIEMKIKSLVSYYNFWVQLVSEC